MALSIKEMAKLRKACNRLEDGPDYRATKSKDFIPNIINTVIDFQMKTPVVQSSQENFFENNTNINSFVKLMNLVNKYPNNKNGNIDLAQQLWGYNHWTRAKFLRVILKRFKEIGITNQKKLNRWIRSSKNEPDFFSNYIKGRFKTKEHSLGPQLFHWLQLRCGVDTVKADVHITNFVSEKVGRKVKPNEAHEALLYICTETNREARLLDSVIWNKMISR